MRSPTIRALLLSATLGLGCTTSVVDPPPDTTKAVYADLGRPRATLSGVVYDPEAFFFSLATFPVENPEEGPPPAVMAGIPFLMQSALPNTRVAVVDDISTLLESLPTSPEGDWQLPGVPADETSLLELAAVPPNETLQLGAELPAPPFTPLPPATYFPTRTIRPLAISGSYCLNQVATAVGSAGALEALALHLTAMGTNTTVSDLLDPNKTGGVLLVWVYSPSFFADFLVAPANGVRMTVDTGTLFTLEWAPPGMVPSGQSAMGYFVSPELISSLGYYAVVLPPGGNPSLTATFTDTVESPEEGRPWMIPELQTTIHPGVSFRRHHAPMAEGPPGVASEPQPRDGFQFLCQM